MTYTILDAEHLTTNELMLKLKALPEVAALSITAPAGLTMLDLTDFPYIQDLHIRGATDLEVVVFADECSIRNIDIVGAVAKTVDFTNLETSKLESFRIEWAARVDLNQLPATCQRVFLFNIDAVVLPPEDRLPNLTQVLFNHLYVEGAMWDWQGFSKLSHANFKGLPASVIEGRSGRWNTALKRVVMKLDSSIPTAEQNVARQIIWNH